MLPPITTQCISPQSQVPSCDISLACHKCGRTMSSLYEQTPESEQVSLGLYDGTGNKGLVTKLWMTDCKHIICHQHFPGGIFCTQSFINPEIQKKIKKGELILTGCLPFYPAADEKPCIPCPVCPSQHLTTLFWIRGTDRWQHDDQIPRECFAEVRRNVLQGAPPSVLSLWVSRYSGPKCKLINEVQC
jgi:hypothetical protein